MESLRWLNYAKVVVQSPIGRTNCQAATGFRENPDVTALDIDRILPAEVFGGFTTLFCIGKELYPGGQGPLGSSTRNRITVLGGLPWLTNSHTHSRFHNCPDRTIRAIETT
jgi:hypothetical protein